MVAAERRAWLPPVALFLLLLVAWQGIVTLFDIPEYILPAPTDIAVVLYQDAQALVRHAWATTTTAVIGLLLGTALGVGIAVLLTVSARIRAALLPLIVVSQSIPMVVLAPIFVVWFGFGLFPRLLVVALVCFFPITLAAASGLLSADRDQVDLVRSMGGGRVDVGRHVLLPGALPDFFTGLKVAASYAMFGAVVGEWIGSAVGLGIYVERSRASYATDQMFAGVTVIALVSVLLFAVVIAAERRAVPWRSAAAHRVPNDPPVAATPSTGRTPS